MSLRISTILWTEAREVPEGASTRYFLVSSSLLSDPYKMKTGTHIKGKILKIDLIEEGELPQFPFDAEFILQVGFSYDHLFLSEKDWELNFREYGIVYVLKVVVILENYTDERNESKSIYSKVEKFA